MSKPTLLQMTQDILSSMSSDEVNSISDTVESLQVANILKQKYFDIIARIDTADQWQLVQFNPSIDPASPVLMTIPDGVDTIKWVKYFDKNPLDGNTSNTFAHDLNVNVTNSLTNPGATPPGYLYVSILPNDEFIDYVSALNTGDSNVSTFTLADTSNGINGKFTFNYNTDRQPTYCTIISNYYVIFDSYDKNIDDTLQASKTMALAAVTPSWQMVDSFTPILAEEHFQLLINEAKALAFYELKQQPHPLAMQEIHRGWTTVQKKKAIINRPSYFDELPGFGRRRGYYGFRGGYYTGYPENTRGGLY